MVSCAKCCKLVARFTGLFVAKILVISASTFFLVNTFKNYLIRISIPNLFPYSRKHPTQRDFSAEMILYTIFE